MFTSEKYVSGDYELKYWIDYPENFEEDRKYPVLFFFHGMGSVRRGFDFIKENCPVRRERIPEDIPMIIIAPYCQDFMWFENMGNIIQFLQKTVSLPFADEDRVYLSGASMGGYTAWMLATLHPELFSAAVICCGGGPYFAAHRIKFPVIAVAGGKDDLVLPRESEIMVERINASGGNARLKVFEDMGHNVWDETFGKAETYRWMISMKKQKKSKASDKI